MDGKSIIPLKGKVIARIYLHIDYPSTLNKDGLISYLVKGIRNSEVGYAGLIIKCLSNNLQKIEELILL